MYNNSAVQVCDTNGLNLKVIWSGNLLTDQLNMSWDDSAGIRRIVYSQGLVVARTIVNQDNSKGKTDTLWRNAWGKDPSVGAGAAQYTSVNKVGHYICFDMPVTAGNMPIIVNLATQVAKNPSNGADGCQARLFADTFGTITYHESTHLTATTIWRWTSNAKIGSIPCPNSQTSGCTDCGNNMYYFCDSDSNYMIQTGDNQSSKSPGCYSKAFIRKGKTTSANMMYLGDFMAFPALWIDPAQFVGTGAMNNRIVPDLCPRISVKFLGGNLTLKNVEGGPVENAVLIGINGAVVARGERISQSQRHFSISSLHAGMYLLSWSEGNGTFSKYITITR
jgi:hypothetical protein